MLIYLFKEEMTPLHGAAWMNNKDVAELLIRYGADVNAIDEVNEL